MLDQQIQTKGPKSNCLRFRDGPTSGSPASHPCPVLAVKANAICKQMGGLHFREKFVYKQEGSRKGQRLSAQAGFYNTNTTSVPC